MQVYFYEASMFSSVHEMMKDLSETIEQLLKNEDALLKIEHCDDYRHELEALEKMQESLLSHAVHITDLIEKDKRMTKRIEERVNTVREKILRYADLNNKEGGCSKIARRKKEQDPAKKWGRQKAARSRIACSRSSFCGKTSSSKTFE